MDLNSRFRGLGRLFVAVLALASVLGRGTDAYITKEEQSFLDWVISEGGELRVTIGRDANGVGNAGVAADAIPFGARNSKQPY